jgi:hypothetical protein
MLCLAAVGSWDNAEIGAVASLVAVALYACHTILVIARAAQVPQARASDGLPAKGRTT